MIKTVHKDRNPKDTLVNIRHILDGLGLFLTEEQGWSHASDHCYSVRVSDAALPLATNGKGVTPLYALASGYGEFMERLQNGFLLKPSYGLMSEEFSFFSDETVLPYAHVVEAHPEILASMIALPMDSADEKEFRDEGFRCAPYFSVNDDKVVMLPGQMIDWSCRTNGLCAGNTPVEALAQGLCEVAERHVIKQIIMSDKFEIPTVPREYVDNSDAAEIVRAIESLGMKVIVKDCSVTGFPVLAVIVLNRDHSQYTVSVGSDPVFGTALERCLTEAFQGHATLDDKSAALDFEFLNSLDKGYPSEHQRRFLEFLAFALDGRSSWPDQFFLDYGEQTFQDAFLPQFISAQHSLSFILDRFKCKQAKVYIRDVSNLGFPAYRIYVPGMSELGLMNLDKPIFSNKKRSFLNRCLLRLKKTSLRDLGEFASILEGVLSFPVYHPRIYTASPFDPKAYFSKSSGISTLLELGLERLIALVYLRLGNYQKAATHYAAYLRTPLGLQATSYERACGLFLKLRAEENDEVEIARVLGSVFGEGLALEVIQDLQTPEQVFQYLVLPECGDCSICPVISDCLFPAWEVAASKMNDAVSGKCIDQAGLRYVLG